MVRPVTIFGLIVFLDHKFRPIFYTHFDTIFKHMYDYEKIYASFLQESVRAHIADIHYLQSLRSNGITCRESWIRALSDLNPYIV